MRTLAHRRLLPPVDLLIAGVPCQPFSRANASTRDPPLGLRDVRELFTAVHNIRQRLTKPHSYIIECTPLAQHLQNDLKQINQWFGEPQIHDMAQFSAQQRTRLCWTNLPMPILDDKLLAGVSLTWHECLDAGATPPLDNHGIPHTKCPTIMASSNSHSDRAKSTWVIAKDQIP